VAALAGAVLLTSCGGDAEGHFCACFSSGITDPGFIVDGGGGEHGCPCDHPSHAAVRAEGHASGAEAGAHAGRVAGSVDGSEEGAARGLHDALVGLPPAPLPGAALESLAGLIVERERTGEEAVDWEGMDPFFASAFEEAFAAVFPAAYAAAFLEDYPDGYCRAHREHAPRPWRRVPGRGGVKDDEFVPCDGVGRGVPSVGSGLVDSR
jgi:hypothetical protein